MNKALLDTDMMSEIGKAIHPAVVRNATAYRRAFGHYTLPAVAVMEVIRGFQKKQDFGRLNAFVASLPSMEILPFADAAADLASTSIYVGKLLQLTIRLDNARWPW